MTYRWLCSTADESNCCSHETLLHDATCEFILRDAVNYKLNSGVGKHLSLRLQAVRSLLTFRGHLRDFSISAVPGLPNIATARSSLRPFTLHPSALFLFMHRDPLDRFLRTDEIDASTKHHLDDIHHDLPSSTTGTQLHASVWRNNGSGKKYKVCESLRFSGPDIFGDSNFP